MIMKFVLLLSTLLAIHAITNAYVAYPPKPEVIWCKDFHPACAIFRQCRNEWLKKKCPKTCGTCEPGYIAVCSPRCLNGDCTGPNICQCKQGWTGNLCQTREVYVPVCSPRCLNGECTAPNICRCKEGWTGNLCQIPVCSPRCLNGDCTGSNICICKQGWTGNLCQTPVCSPRCINGDCTGPTICQCKQGWTGNHCQTEDKFKHCETDVPDIYMPYCGSDGKNYKNKWAFDIAQCRNPKLTITSRRECDDEDYQELLNN